MLPYNRKLSAGLNIKLHRLNHILGEKDGIKLLLGENAVLENDIVDTTTCSHSLLSNLRRVLIADDGLLF